ncbi:MAG: hypothetical protein D4S01_03905 [Dehalococcoidia bacterium]|nr:MAG: hypothetical protein D4S01_03905 [Dehalococcoidia bacterium]
MKLYIILILALVITIPIFADDVTLTKNGWRAYDAAQYNLNNEQNTAVNAAVTGYDLLRTGVMYRGNGPAQKITSTGAVVASGLVANGTSAWTLVTHEVIDNSIAKYIYATAEILAWQSAATLEAGERCYYVALYPYGTAETNAKCITILQGTEYDATTETALYPTITANYIPICSIHVITTDAAFVPSTTNFNATGVTSTIQTISGPIPSGASAPADTGLSDVDMTVDRY